MSVSPGGRVRSLAVATLAALPLLVGAPAAAAAEFHVDSSTDGTDLSPGDGRCMTAAGTCTVRAAVQESDASGGADVVVLPAGRLVMTRPNVWPLPNQTADLEVDAAQGDIDILGQLTIRGAGADRTTIDAGHLDRAFNVEPRARVAISDLAITNGDATTSNKNDADIALGGAILNTGTVTLERVALVGNHGDGGGGMFSTPGATTTVRDSLIADNRAVEGGGLRLDSGGTVINTTITGNVLEPREFGKFIPDEITGYGGGIDHRGGDDVTIINSTIADNHAYKAGGGVNSGQDYAPVLPAELWPHRVYLQNTIVAGNTADHGGANCHVSAMIIKSRGHNLASDDSCYLTAAGDLPNRDPLLGPLTADGGPTPTRALLAGSPAIDAAARGACPPRDQRGVTRPQGAGCDIGAYELRVSSSGGWCTSRRRFVIRLPRGWRSARVSLAGKPLRVTRRNGRLTAIVDLRSRTGRRVRLVARGVTRSGRAAREVRTYRPCAPRSTP